MDYWQFQSQVIVQQPYRWQYSTTGLNVSQITQTIWVTWVTFLEGQVSLICKLAKLSGCDPNITCSLETVLASGKWANFGSEECTEISLVWILYQAVLKRMVSKDFIIKKTVQGTDFGILLTMKKSVALFHIKIFYITLHCF